MSVQRRTATSTKGRSLPWVEGSMAWGGKEAGGQAWGFSFFPGWRGVMGHGHHTGDPLTFHVSHKDVSICPLVNPMLEGAAFEHDL